MKIYRVFTFSLAVTLRRLRGGGGGGGGGGELCVEELSRYYYESKRENGRESRLNTRSREFKASRRENSTIKDRYEAFLSF